MYAPTIAPTLQAGLSARPRTAARGAARLSVAAIVSPTATAAAGPGIRAARIPHAARSLSATRLVSCRATDEDNIAAAKEALDQAQAVPQEVSQDDMNKFYRIVSHPEWDDVQAEVNALVEAGELTEGVLEAAFMVMERCKETGESEDVLASITNVVQLVLGALSQQNASPAIRLVDQCSKIMAEDPENGLALCETVVREALTVSPEELNKESFLAEMKDLFMTADRSDLAFYSQAEEWRKTASPEELAQLDQMEEMRKGARKQMELVKGIAEAL
mmetsp:Transcript_24937/g.78983  ORF Transcript_24937/g.78983 Transcript_24937/m.78983 type:complete len:275 (+) Transcript_24937:1165-1989(+)